MRKGQRLFEIAPRPALVVGELHHRKRPEPAEEAC